MRHRLVLVVAAAVLGGLTLSGCQHDPEVAATVDGQVIKQAQVDQIFDASPPALNLKQVPGQFTPGPVTRTDVLRSLVLAKMCTDLQAQEHFPPANVTPANIPTLYDVTAESPFAVQEAKTRSCLFGLAATTEKAAPTAAEAQAIYDRAVAGGLKLDSFAEVKDTITNDDGIQQYIGYKHAVDRMVKASTVDLSPRYRGLEFLLDAPSAAPLIALPVGPAGSDAIKH